MEQAKRVFKEVAFKYDLMSDIMSFFLHRLWKNSLIKKAEIKNNYKILDLAAGTGDISLRILKNKNFQGKIILADFNKEMLEIAKYKLKNYDISQVEFLENSAHKLELESNSLDLVLVSLGFRHFVEKEQALEEIYRVLKPEGKILILDFYNPKNKFLFKLYNFYLKIIIPKIAELLFKQGENYKYLAQSINNMQSQDELLELLKQKFKEAEFKNLFLDLVSIHKARK